MVEEKNALHEPQILLVYDARASDGTTPRCCGGWAF